MCAAGGMVQCLEQIDLRNCQVHFTKLVVGFFLHSTVAVSYTHLDVYKRQGYVQPYADNPLDDEHTGENVYMNILNSAQEYAYFITPYLLISDEMNKAFTLAARRGVDVRIITPGIPDKMCIRDSALAVLSALSFLTSELMTESLQRMLLYLKN